MYLKLLQIIKGKEVIRNIEFHNGLNLIVDETKNENVSTNTGNNVGKTTVLKLIYFCFGGDGKEIYSSSENMKDQYPLVKNYLIEKEIIIKLVLKEDLTKEDAKEITIERNFLNRNKKFFRIDGVNYKEDKFKTVLRKKLFPNLDAEKPTLKQIIGHNIRYKDQSITNTIKFLDKFTKDVEYEILFLFLLGISYDKGIEKQDLLTKLAQEKRFKDKLETKTSKTNYEMLLAATEHDIQQLNIKKNQLNINKQFEEDLEALNQIKLEINHMTEKVSILKVRKDLIKESKEELSKQNLQVDIEDLKFLYEEVSANLDEVTKSFDELIVFHNQMIKNKINYIENELPEIEQRIANYTEKLSLLLEKEEKYVNIIKKSDTFADLENIIQQLNEKHQKKGEYKSIIEKINEIDNNLIEIQKEIDSINDDLMSEDNQTKLKSYVTRFNGYFQEISKYLYNEKYLLSFEIKENKSGQKYYYFYTFNENLSSGKKQGEILCFDIALIKYLDSLKIDHLSFILNDKKELMDNNQLIKVAEYAEENNIQLVFSMLEDKIPNSLNNDKNIVLRLSQYDKLFKIENE